MGGFWTVLVGCALWGLGMGFHESNIPAAVATMGCLKNAGHLLVIYLAYGISFFIGSVITGWLYEISLPALIIFAVGMQLASIPFFISLREKRS
jgi:predicted MFS family arabinose efflux permease